jgi:GAF domain-containing protein
MTISLQALRECVHAGREITSTPSLDVVLRLIVGLATRLTGAAYGTIVVNGPDGALAHFSSADGEARGPNEQQPSNDVLALLLRDANDGAVVRYGGGHGVTGDQESETAGPPFIGVPIRLLDEVLGAFYLVGRRVGSFSERDELLLEHFAQQAALSIGNACLLWQALERAEQLSALSELSSLINSGGGSRDICNAVARAATLVLDAAVARVWVYEPATHVLRVQGVFAGDPRFEPELWRTSSVWDTAAHPGVVFTGRVPRYLDDIVLDRENPDASITGGHQLRAYAGVPIVTGSDAVGVLSVLFTDARSFTREEKELITLLADQAAGAIQNVQLLEETRRRREAEVLVEIARNAAPPWTWTRSSFTWPRPRAS